MLLSIIIPVYNIQDYVARCLDSCLNQDLPATEYEVIAVDDGSTDGSAGVIRPYLPKYSNLKYVYQENQGLSGARNTGLSHATGDYIWFVDGDDTIRKDCLKKISKFVLHAKCDIFTFNFSTENHSLSIPADRQMTGREFIRHYPSTLSACRSWYRKAFLQENQLLFTPGLLHEDGEFNLRALLLANSVIYHPEIFYTYYTNRQGSIIHGNFFPRMESMIRIVKSGKDFLDSREPPIPVDRAIADVFCCSIIPAMRMMAHPGITMHPVRQNYALLQTIVAKSSVSRIWKAAFRLPAVILCGILKMLFLFRQMGVFFRPTHIHKEKSR